jgi:hypothetical protein
MIDEVKLVNGTKVPFKISIDPVYLFSYDLSFAFPQNDARYTKRILFVAEQGNYTGPLKYI